jgi:hypothetical protein
LSFHVSSLLSQVLLATRSVLCPPSLPPYPPSLYPSHSFPPPEPFSLLLVGSSFQCHFPSQRLLINADPISSSYTYDICILFVSIDLTTSCLVSIPRLMDVLKIIPPFTYSYQCGSTLLVAYIPVYMYTASLQILANVGRFAVIFLTKPENFPPWSWKFLPGIAWPNWHMSHNSLLLLRKQDTSTHILNAMHKDPSLENSNSTAEQMNASSTTLLRLARIISTAMNNTLLLLSFGLTSPVLACFLLLNINLTLSFWMLLIGRYVFVTMAMERHSSHRTTLEKEDREGVEMVLGLETRSKSLQEQCEQGCLAIPNSPMMRNEIIELSSCLEGVSGYIRACRWPVLFTSCFFISLLCWDIVGDQIGWKDSLWIPGSGVFTLLLFWIHGRSSIRRESD